MDHYNQHNAGVPASYSAQQYAQQQQQGQQHYVQAAHAHHGYGQMAHQQAQQAQQAQQQQQQVHYGQPQPQYQQHQQHQRQSSHNSTVNYATTGHAYQTPAASAPSGYAGYSGSAPTQRSSYTPPSTTYSTAEYDMSTYGGQGLASDLDLGGISSLGGSMMQQQPQQQQTQSGASYSRNHSSGLAQSPMPANQLRPPPYLTPQYDWMQSEPASTDSPVTLYAQATPSVSGSNGYQATPSVSYSVTPSASSHAYQSPTFRHPQQAATTGIPSPRMQPQVQARMQQPHQSPSPTLQLGQLHHSAYAQRNSPSIPSPLAGSSVYNLSGAGAHPGTAGISHGGVVRRPSSGPSPIHSPYQRPGSVQVRVPSAAQAASQTYSSSPVAHSVPHPVRKGSVSSSPRMTPGQSSPLVQSTTVRQEKKIPNRQDSLPKPLEELPKPHRELTNPPKALPKPKELPKPQTYTPSVQLPSLPPQLLPSLPLADFELPQTINPADIFAPQFSRPRLPPIVYHDPGPEVVVAPEVLVKPETKPEAKAKDMVKKQTVQPAAKKQAAPKPLPLIPAVIVPAKYLNNTAPKAPSNKSSSQGRATLANLLASAEPEEHSPNPKPQSKAKPKPKPEKSALDDHVRYDAVLIGLSNEYMEAAYRLGPRVARMGGDVEESEKPIVEEYQNLVAMSLSCLEAALKNFKFVPAIEAGLIQRYVTLMFEETENWDEMAAYLSKGIALCDRHKLHDQKYCMHHLLARVTNCRNPNAALKALDKVIKEVEQKNIAPWEYALRFLHVSLSLERATHHDVVVALQHLRAISDLSEKYSDKAVFVHCAALEALAYIYTETPDCVTSAQDSIARARSLQMDRSTQDIQSVWYFISCVDLICSLLRYEGAEIIAQKIEAIRAIAEKNPFSKDGSLAIPLGPRSSGAIKDLGAKIFTKEGETVVLQFHWMPEVAVYALACLLSTCTGILKMAAEKKNPKFIHEGLNSLKNYLARDPNVEPAETQSRSTVQKRLRSTYQLRWYMKLYQILLLGIHSKWNLARTSLGELEGDLASDENLRNESLERWATYARAMIEQGTGNLEAAAKLYRSPILLAPSANSNGMKLLGTAAYDLSVLSRLNLLFLLRDPTMPSLEAGNLLSDLESRLLPSEHPSSALHIALDLNRALNTPSSAILAKKKPLQNALMRSSNRGSNQQNDQLSCVAMGALVHLFFRDMISGDGQAAKSRETLLKLALRLGSPLWTSMAQGMMLQGEVLAGREDDVRRAWEEVGELARDMRAEGVEAGFL